MLLRASGEKEGLSFNVSSVTAEDLDSGVPHGAHLRALTEAAIRGEWDALTDIRTKAAADMGEQAVVDALVVASAFNGITRVADATGIPLDENTALTTSTLREETGIQKFEYSAKSQRYDSA